MLIKNVRQLVTAERQLPPKCTNFGFFTTKMYEFWFFYHQSVRILVFFKEMYEYWGVNWRPWRLLPYIRASDHGRKWLKSSAPSPPKSVTDGIMWPTALYWISPWFGGPWRASEGFRRPLRASKGLRGPKGVLGALEGFRELRRASMSLGGPQWDLEGLNEPLKGVRVSPTLSLDPGNNYNTIFKGKRW